MLFSPKLNPSSYLLQFFSSSNLSLIQSHRYIGQTQSILLISNRFKGFWLLYVCVWNFGWWWRECVLGNTSLGKRLVKGTLQKSNSLQILFLANRLPSKSSTSLVPVASTSLFRFLHFESTLFLSYSRFDWLKGGFKFLHSLDFENLQIKREIRTLKILKHPNIVRLHEVHVLIAYGDYWMLVIEFFV